MRQYCEKALVRNAVPGVLTSLGLSQSQCNVTHELAVGHSIADIVVLRRPGVVTSWPARPLSLVESSVLGTLRQLKRATTESIADAVFMEGTTVRKILSGRLSRWKLVRSQGCEYVALEDWVRESQVIAIEAKLTRWRDAISQAEVYLRYADSAFVLLPERTATVAAEHRDAFDRAGVGLLSFADGNVVQVVAPSAPTAQLGWHREFAISRIR